MTEGIEKFISCDRCGIVFAERRRIGDWTHYVELHSGTVLPASSLTLGKICEPCMN